MILCYPTLSESATKKQARWRSLACMSEKGNADIDFVIH